MLRLVVILGCVIAAMGKHLQISAERKIMMHNLIENGVSFDKANQAADEYFDGVGSIKALRRKIFRMENNLPDVEENEDEEEESTDIDDQLIAFEQIKPMLAALKQRVADLKDPKARHTRAIRNFVLYPGNRWTMPIPYTIAANVDTIMSQGIDESVAHITSQVPCITFKKVASCTGQPGDYCITFYTHDPFVTQCRADSPVGRVANSPIRMGKCPTKDIAKMVLIHEICHNLGMPHTQSRPDRDSYVTIVPANIVAGAEGNFVKETVDGFTTYNMPYDFKSIMHYSQWTFAKENGNPAKPVSG